MQCISAVVCSVVAEVKGFGMDLDSSSEVHIISWCQWT